jgi:CRISPR system Cascade subunit CasC
MKTLELHILQSFPVTCLNRDDVGAPKSALFGGIERARVSSQCWKRAIRLMAKELAPDSFGGDRTRYILPALKKALAGKGLDENAATKAADELADAAFGKKDEKHEGAVKTLFYTSPMEIDAVVSAYCDETDPKKKVKAAIKVLQGSVKDKADISVFGRMVADDHSLMVEGAGMFSHAVSTHKVSNEIDFFTAVDDLKPEESEGAGHMGTNEFNSACYYRYIALNLDLLKNQSHLAILSDEEFRAVVDAFIRASVLAVPNARKNSMMGFNPPEYVLGTIREGQPVSLVNAFEKAVKPGQGGYVEESVKRMEDKFQWMGKTYGFKPSVALRIPETGLDDFCKGLVDNV